MDHSLNMDRTRSKLLQLFHYIQAFNLIQNPVQRDITSQLWMLEFKQLPRHAAIRIGIPALTGDYSSDIQDNTAVETDERFLLKVRRPTLPEPPEPPAQIIAYLEHGWNDPLKPLAFDPHVRADDQRSALFEKWLLRYNNWVVEAQPAYQVQRLFDTLYALRTQLERETEQVEFMVGDGMLCWQTSRGITLNHPMLLLRVQLDFDPQIPEFTVRETDAPPEFYSALFQGVAEINARNLSSLRQDFEEERYSPLGGEDTGQFLQRLVNHLSPRGQYVNAPVAQSLKQHAPADPLIFRQPVLFLPKRTLGFSSAIERILEDIPQREYLPYALTSLVGLTVQPNRVVDEQAPIQPDTVPVEATSSQLVFAPNGEDEHILLSKEANAEQLEIAQKLEKYGAVLVQGPPGTGKTHTIANLLGHLLAQGKSVLVTSHTSKALRVLHEKIVPPLQPLCVSMLDDDNRRQMERTIDAITERLSTESEQRLEQEATQLARQRVALIQQIRTDRETLKLARNSEYEAILVDGAQYAPADAARFIASHADDDWVQDPVALDASLPLAWQEFVDLYRTNTSVSMYDEQEIAQGLPSLQQLFSPADFEQCVTEMQELQLAQEQLQRENLTYRRDLWRPFIQKQTAAPFQELQLKLEEALDFLRDESPLRLAVIHAGQIGGVYRQIWDELIARVEYVYNLAAQASPLLLEYDPYVPEACMPDRIEKVLAEVLAYLETGKKLNGISLLMHADWKTLLHSAQVQGHAPESREHFQALLALVTVRRFRKELVGRWQRQVAPFDAHSVLAPEQRPEVLYHQYVYQLRQCLNWYTAIWMPLENQLRQQGLLWEKLLAELPVTMSEYDQVLKLRIAVREHLPALLVAEQKRRQYRVNEQKLRGLEMSLQRMLTDIQPTALNKRLQRAIEQRNVVEYRALYIDIVTLHERQKELATRHILLAKLERVAPSWAASIRLREGMHSSASVPPHLDEAWLTKKLKDELNRRTKISLAEVQERITRNSAALQRLTAELVEKRAWAAQIRRTTLEQQRALQGWKELMRKVGKGTGKRAPQLLARARALMPMCQTAVPVWIMPLSRVVQNFDPRKNHFDVVIVDEASQADIKALTAMYMGSQIVIVGDHEQVTPLAVGQDLDEIDRLIHEHLEGIPLKELYDGKLSIYGLAMTTFNPVCLREHFRCVSPIIQFSNTLSYDGKIKPLRDDSTVKIRPATIEYRVNGVETRGYVNEEEAVTIASLIVAASEQEEYRDASMGVISMLHDEQALRIDTLLRRHLSAPEYMRRHILCGNPAQFQGDERDVMFLSLVDTPNEDGPLTLRDEDARDFTAKKRFNVAASRARDQMWVVHSLDPDLHLKHGDIRKKLILHARNASITAQKIIDQEKRTESEFERQVLQRLMRVGYRVIPQWPVGAYRIDLVVEGNGRRLAVECDGDRWHPIEKLEEDMERQAILERLGWRFVRIRGSQFFRDPEKSMEPLFARLQSLEISPESNTGREDMVAVQDGEILKQRVIRRAAELRQQWIVEEQAMYGKVVPLNAGIKSATRRSV